jgi:hypothetical protein
MTASGARDLAAVKEEATIYSRLPLPVASRRRVLVAWWPRRCAASSLSHHVRGRGQASRWGSPPRIRGARCPGDGQERRPSRSRVVLDDEPADEQLGLPGIADGGAGKQLRGLCRRAAARLGRPARLGRWLVEQSREGETEEAIDLDSGRCGSCLVVWAGLHVWQT